MFPNSTQCRHWTFSVNDLKTLRQEVIERKQQREGEHLSLEEEGFLRVLFELRIQHISKMCRLPDKVMATALTFFKRFLLHRSLEDSDPVTLIYSSLFLSCKAEEKSMSLREFCRRMRLPNKNQIVDGELALLAGLRYQLVVYHPFRSIQGFLTDMKGTTHQALDTHVLEEKACKWAHASLLTDCCFLCPPAQIALACLWRAGEELGCDVERYIRARFQDPPGTADELMQIIGQISSLVESTLGNASLFPDTQFVEQMPPTGEPSGPPESAAARSYAVSLLHKYCMVRNPVYNPNSVEYRRMQEEAAEELEAKRQEKFKKIREAEEQEIAELTGLDDIGKGDQEFVLHTHFPRHDEGDEDPLG